MDTSKKSGKSGYETRTSHMGESASDFIHEGKKLVNDIYEDGRHRVSQAKDTVREYSDDLSEKIRRNPVGSVLIAAGVGFLLSAILRK